MLGICEEHTEIMYIIFFILILTEQKTHAVTHFILRRTLGRIYLHFTDAETQTWRGKVTFPQQVTGRIGIQTQAVWFQIWHSVASSVIKGNPEPLHSVRFTTCKVENYCSLQPCHCLMTQKYPPNSPQIQLAKGCS